MATIALATYRVIHVRVAPMPNTPTVRNRDVVIAEIIGQFVLSKLTEPGLFAGRHPTAEVVAPRKFAP
ncbi:hypothetical protein [Burkholderia ubonensis]|uniref:hypothetical protein n=1 Tax=Burkholderia ubonensis TaxID=101571 RepID=UPI0010560709|nr:hypothetical protein [Burkholderia ubonensis]